MSHTPPIIEVACGLLYDPEQDAVLMSQRRADQSYPGYWEFPGGKKEPAETWDQTLVRELQEELGITVLSFRTVFETAQNSSNQSVHLVLYQVLTYQGLPYGREGQRIKWWPKSDLTTCAPVLLANKQINAALQQFCLNPVTI